MRIIFFNSGPLALRDLVHLRGAPLREGEEGGGFPHQLLGGTKNANKRLPLGALFSLLLKNISPFQII